METTTRSRQQFCRRPDCGHNRSAHGGNQLKGGSQCCLCMCNHYIAAADAPKPTRPKLSGTVQDEKTEDHYRGPCLDRAVAILSAIKPEPSPNARARDAAVVLLKAALTTSPHPFDDVKAALVYLEAIS